MDNQPQKDVWLNAAECARRIGLSVRALRVYESYGLIAPRRTHKGWRLYGANELARLNEVLALKGLGLRLSAIAELLRGQRADIGQLLVMQQQILRGLRERTDRGLALIEALQSKIAIGCSPSIDDLMNLAKETSMTDTSRDTIAWRRYEQNRPRTEITIDRALYDEFAGTYQIESGPFYVVTHSDGHLFVRVVGQHDIEVFPEGDARFFMKILPVQVVFERDADGKVASLVHHQHGTESKAHRVDPAEGRRNEEEIEKRIRDNIPMPNSEETLRTIIENEIRGEPDLSGMAPALAALVREQAELTRTSMSRAGALKTLTFKRVRNGLDIYDVQFENVEMEWGFAVGQDGKIIYLYMRG